LDGIWIRRLIYVALIAGLFFATDALYQWSQASPYFRIRRIDVSGNRHLSRSVVRARLGLGQTDNLLSLSLETLRGKLEGHPWVRSVSLSRNLPGTLRVGLVERKPWAVFAPAGVRDRYLIDEEGVILGEAGAGSERFPVVRGYKPDKGKKAYRVGHVLSGEAFQTGLTAIRAYQAIERKVLKQGARMAAVDLRDFSRGRTSVRKTILIDILGPRGQATLIRLSPGDMEQGLRRFSALIRLWKGQSWPGEVDLSMGNRVVVR
jgi:hypothetical protein